MMAVIQSTEGPPIAQYRLSAHLRHFLTQCFTRDVDLRPTARQLRKHQFIVGPHDANARFEHSGTEQRLGSVERRTASPSQRDTLLQSVRDARLATIARGYPMRERERPRARARSLSLSLENAIAYRVSPLKSPEATLLETRALRSGCAFSSFLSRTTKRQPDGRSTRRARL